MQPDAEAKSETGAGPAVDRRLFVRAGALVGAGLAAAVAGVFSHRRRRPPDDPVGETTIRVLDVLDRIPPAEGEDLLLRMQRDLVRAMARPVESRHWIMLIDHRKCVGCHACTIGCVAENKLPPGVVYRPVVTEERGTFPRVHLQFTPRPCMQCENPPCTPVCPVRATWKRPDGVVVVDYDRCIGCRYCLTACPYGARTSDFGEYYTAGVAEGAPRGEDRPVDGDRQVYEDRPAHEYGKSWTRANHASPIGNARKCHFCLHRLEGGRLPMCVTTCIGRATFFGDENDADSLVAELKARHNVHVLLAHKGTKPQVFYIG
jgi:molybdopterin-containing oxidoreductase family iron-sulfur binding subunit